MSLRFDRLATLHIVSPLRHKLSIGRQCIPILMYHSISDTSEEGRHPYYRTVTSPAVFAQHLAYLRKSGYSAITPAQAVDRLEGGAEATGKVAVITFDDAFADFHDSAFPLLQQYEFTATVYIPTAFIKQNRASFKSHQCMTWDEIRQLQRAGISFGSHTVTHPQLYGLTDPRVTEEVETSKQTIEQQLGCRVESFAYPFAFPDTATAFKKNLREILRRAGYRNGVCTSIGTAKPGGDEFFLKRLPVNACDDLALFEAKLSGAYDWLFRPQYFSKLAKKWQTPARPLEASIPARKD